MKLKLLLDEHYSYEIAIALRKKGYDVVAAQEKPKLMSMSDRELLTAATEAGRALVTENIADFVPITHELTAKSMDHCGIVLVSAKRYPRSKRAMGSFISALTDFLKSHGEGRYQKNVVSWL